MTVLILLSLLFTTGKAPVTWSHSVVKAGTQEYNIIFTATIEEGWNIYSQYLASDEGPVKTSITFQPGSHFALVGKNEEAGTIKKGHDEMFDMEVIKISKKGTFTQKVKIFDTTKPITGVIEYMCCNDLQCLPPKEVPFTIDLTSAK